MVALNKFYPHPNSRNRHQRHNHSRSQHYARYDRYARNDSQQSDMGSNLSGSLHLSRKNNLNSSSSPKQIKSAKQKKRAPANSSRSNPNPNRKKTRVTVSTPLKAMWVIIGLLLTIGSTFLQPSIAIPSWTGTTGTIEVEPIKVTLQVGAVLLTGCLGGKGAGLVSQILYIFLGLSGFAVFYQGGGIGYLQEPAFGYLLGFIPGAWVCGFLAFLRPANLERLTVSCLGGLITIHLVGIAYLFALRMPDLATINELVFRYSVQILPEQMFVVCATVVVATLFRRLLFY
ncbi:BioY protein [Thalassoporum mexicanum PCC 7367]|uniref:biotin transporter BioY n=1 Tax=Thalassoporum mexicanum TaxID=3457544 RepID=UPI00029FBB23|nr:biotin transporter BioY [Pseudanabaena sp. PCC 7367]AFY71333.1 BioY protein [Pseudanabaena sp. PCC 7367]